MSEAKNTPEDGNDRFPRSAGKQLPTYVRNNPKERKRNSHCRGSRKFAN
jgi:hypothetical protein